jgi:hypothetical protein
MSTDPGSDVGPAYATSGAEDHTQQSTATVRRPKGHANAWNYKFCGECGSPIGLVAPLPGKDAAADHSESSTT